MERSENSLVILDSDDDMESVTSTSYEPHINTDDIEQAFEDVACSREPLQELPINWAESWNRKITQQTVSPDELDYWTSSNRIHFKPAAIVLASGMDVELCGGVFLRIHDILTNPLTSRTFLRGLVFLRNGQQLTSVARTMLAYQEDDMSQFLITHPNEIHMSCHILDSEPQSSKQQSSRLFPIENFVRVRSIIITNQIFPALNSGVFADTLVDTEQPDDTLVCRWITVKSWSSQKNRDLGTQVHCIKLVVRIRQHESDQSAASSDADLISGFRGKTIRGGDAFGLHRLEHDRRCYEAQRSKEADDPHFERNNTSALPKDVAPIVLNDSSDTGRVSEYLELTGGSQSDCAPLVTDEFWNRTWEPVRPMMNPEMQRYSFADVFAGCGGVSSAAAKSGFCVKYAVEWDPIICATYQHNNPTTRVANVDVRDFLQYNYDKFVDIMHLSPPCQPFSKAHTTPGKRDSINREALGTLEAYLMAARPRIVTIEEADALATFSKHSEHLQRILRQLTILNYSVEFRVLNFADYGICQKRQRLVIMASCPGQRLPGFPDKTHTDHHNLPNSNLFPWVTTEEAISEIPHFWRHHDPGDIRLYREGNEAAPGTLCPTLITKNGHLLHPEGWRQFTIMERLVIQGFPIHFEFPLGQSHSSMEKQIGNAVPPKAFEVIFQHIKDELLKDDGMLD